MSDESTPMHPCARCARVQSTCCQRTEILVTEADRDRIARHAGRLDFWERRPVSDPSYVEPDPEDPGWVAATVAADGTRAMLVKRENGDCTFLGEAGCVLPEETRPLVCRIYPYAYTHAGLSGEDPEYCPLELVDPHGAGMTKVLGMARNQAEAWRAQLYRELGISTTSTSPTKP